MNLRRAPPSTRPCNWLKLPGQDSASIPQARPDVIHQLYLAPFHHHGIVQSINQSFSVSSTRALTMFLNQAGGLHNGQHGLLVQLQKAAKSPTCPTPRPPASAFFPRHCQRRTSFTPKLQLLPSEPKDHFLGNQDVGRMPRAAVSPQLDARSYLGEEASCLYC